MTIKDYVDRANISFSELVERTDIPESTLRDILNGNSDLRRCSALTVSKLATALNVPAEGLILLEPIAKELPKAALSPVHDSFNASDFRAFRRDSINELNLMGREYFIQEVLDNQIVEDEYSRHAYANALFLIGLTDYLADKEPVTFRNTRYDRYRGDMMKRTIYPFGCLTTRCNTAALMNKAIPELLKFNIIETEYTIQIP